MKRKWIAPLVLCFMLGGTACDFSALLGGTGSNNSELENSSVVENTNELAYEQLLDKQAVKTIAAGETVTYTVDKRLGDRNYVKLNYAAEVDLYGEFVYSDLENPDKVVQECFFLEAGDTEFRQFLDAYRPNGIGLLYTKYREAEFRRKPRDSRVVRWRFTDES